MATQNTRRSPAERSPYSEQAPRERAAGRADVWREHGPLTERVRAVLAAEEEQRRVARLPQPGDIPELEAASPSAFTRAVLGATGSRAPSTLRAGAPPSSRRLPPVPPHVERAMQKELRLGEPQLLGLGGNQGSIEMHSRSAAGES